MVLGIGFDAGAWQTLGRDCPDKLMFSHLSIFIRIKSKSNIPESHSPVLIGKNSNDIPKK